MKWEAVKEDRITLPNAGGPMIIFNISNVKQIFQFEKKFSIKFPMILGVKKTELNSIQLLVVFILRRASTLMISGLSIRCLRYSILHQCLLVA